MLSASAVAASLSLSLVLPTLPDKSTELRTPLDLVPPPGARSLSHLVLASPFPIPKNPPLPALVTMTTVAPSSLTPPNLEVPCPLLHRRPGQSPRPRRHGRHQLSMSPVVLSLLPHSLTLLLLISLADLTASDYLDDNRCADSSMVDSSIELYRIPKSLQIHVMNFVNIM